MAPDEPDSLPSRTLILDILRAERDERRGHSDALDQKAGLALGFAGVLVTLSTDIAQPWRSLGAVAAMSSAALALWSFWPRPYPVLHNLRDYLAAAPEQTELVLVDTLDEMGSKTDEAASSKARRLKGALAALAAAVMLLGVGVIQHDSGGDNDEQGNSAPGAAASAPTPAGSAG